MRTLLGIALSWIVTAATAGCERLPDREFAALESALTLRIARVRPDGVGQTRYDLELTNRGAARALACLGPGRHVGGGSMTWVDHPGCVREFELAPRAALAWSETHAVTASLEGLVEASIKVEILNPRRCSAMGCSGFVIESQPLTTPK